MVIDDDTRKMLGETAYIFVKNFYKETKQKAKDFFVKNKVGFIPPGIDYSFYQQLKDKSAFKQLKYLVGKKHPTLPIILTGLYLATMDKEGRKSCVEMNRNQIYKKHGKPGIAVMNMAQTGYIIGFIKWLSKYGIENNLSEQEALDLYEASLEMWQEIAIFVQTKHVEGTIYNKCVAKMSNDTRVFFLFASYSAIKTSTNVVKKLSQKELGQYGYEVEREKINDNEDELVWIFEKKQFEDAEL